MLPGTPGEPTPPVFLSCSADNTVRLWQADDRRSWQRASLGAVSLTYSAWSDAAQLVESQD